MSCLWMLIISVQQPVKQCWLVNITAHILAKIVMSELKIGLLRNMKFVTLSVKDHTQFAVIAAKLHATATYPVLFAQNSAKSAAVIQNVASCAMSPAYYVLRIVPDLVHIAGSIHYSVQYPVICYYAQSAVQKCWLVGINVCLFVERSVKMLHIVRFVRTW